LLFFTVAAKQILY